MKFREFRNPEEKDYDISSSLNDNVSNNQTINPYVEELMNLIGILEDVTEEDLQEQYGISEYEYLHPDREVIEKVKAKLSSNKGL